MMYIIGFMRNKFIKIATISTIFAFGVGLLATKNIEITPLRAEQHAENYDEYIYSGNYYSTISDSLTEGMNGTLRQTLSGLILPKQWYTYSGSTTGTLGKILQSADEDPTNRLNMVMFYSRDSVTKQASSNDGWNREHVWPQSLSNNHWGKEKAGADLLHIRPTWSSTNSKRGNTVYGDVNKASPLTYGSMIYAYEGGSYFEPLDSVKGDVARILMYIWTAYYDYYGDTNLKITSAIQSYDVLLKWHALDKPDDLEGNRNDFSESSIQKNRNPFVDHPEYALKIFGDQVNEEAKQACLNAYPNKQNDETPNPDSSSSSSNSSSSEITSSSIVDSSSQEETKKSSKGCNGAIVTTLSLTSVGALIGIVFIFSKRKK